MNGLKAAQKLVVYPNTICDRWKRILNLTGLDARTSHALSDLLIVVDGARRSSVDLMDWTRPLESMAARGHDD
jgi:hypothetical protein